MLRGARQDELQIFPKIILLDINMPRMNGIELLKHIKSHAQLKSLPVVIVSYKDKEEVQSGYVIKVGPGYPIPLPAEDNEPWKTSEEQIKYIPLQAREGDKAIFMQKGAVEIIYEDEKYYIVPQHSILLLERDDSLFE
jgi:CheY-like chemotaxis protein